ncbi:MAG: RNA 3'-terminal phosphate cyclase [Myxococcota bacterium]
MVTLDGREGEGGGQVLRSALSLSLITGIPFRLEHVRAKRRAPGLKAQHLSCVLGAAQVGHAKVEGARLASSTVEFHPGPMRPGDFSLDVGTAGATSLLLQCLAYPLALAGGGTLSLHGGTHVSMSPVFEYLTEVWAPLLAVYGLDVKVWLKAAGFFPQGGGVVHAQVGPPREVATALTRPEEGREAARVFSIVGGLPVHIASRQAEAARAKLMAEGLRVDVEAKAYETKHSRGSAVLVVGERGLRHFGASALGERGKPAEAVGGEAAKAFLAEVRTGGDCDSHLGDQLLFPAALAAAGRLGPKRPTHFTAARVTDHLTTHARVLEQFLPVKVDVDGRRVAVREA